MKFRVYVSIGETLPPLHPSRSARAIECEADDAGKAKEQWVALNGLEGIDTTGLGWDVRVEEIKPEPVMTKPKTQAKPVEEAAK